MGDGMNINADHECEATGSRINKLQSIKVLEVIVHPHKPRLDRDTVGTNQMHSITYRTMAILMVLRVIQT